MIDYAEEAAAVSTETKPHPRMCCARGCFLLGSIADSTTGGNDWYCRLHHNAPYSEHAGISARMANRRRFFVLAARLNNALPGQPVPAEVSAWLTRNHRAATAQAFARSRQKTAQNLGAQLARELESECAAPQGRLANESPAGQAGRDTWNHASEFLKGLA